MTKTHEDKTWAAKRKSLKKQAEAKYPTRTIGWVGGILYFLDTHEVVAGIETVPKPGQAIGGWDAAYNNQPPVVKQSAPHASSRNRHYLSTRAGEMATCPACGKRRDTWRGENEFECYGCGAILVVY